MDVRTVTWVTAHLAKTMDVHTVAACDELLAGIPAMRGGVPRGEPRGLDAEGSHRERLGTGEAEGQAQALQGGARLGGWRGVLEMGLQRMRGTITWRLEPATLTETPKVSSPSTERLRDTTMKNRPAPSTPWRDLDDGPRENIPSPAADNVRQVPPRRGSILRSASPERRRPPTRISWDEDIEAVCIIPARELHVPARPPCSSPPLSGAAFADAAAATSRSGVKLAQQNRLNLQPRPVGDPEANLESISHRCYLREAALEWELTKETIDLPLSCLEGGSGCLSG